jgi:nucleoside-diphosphate-sugar epimerase
MRILVLGGTRFLGRSFVAAALEDGHSVTVFSRGVSGRPLEGADHIIGDRTTPDDLKPLTGHRWDVVVDTSGFVPTDVGLTALSLRNRASHYIFISTVSAYRDFPTRPVDATSPLLDCSPDEDDGRLDYGMLKAGCERAVLRNFGPEVLIIRPGMLIGPHDDNGRLPWWIIRLSRPEPAVAPGDPALPVRLLDVRDLAAFLVKAAVDRLVGHLLVTAPAGALTMGEMLSDISDLRGGRTSLVWQDDDELIAAGVEPMKHLPYWMPKAALWDTDTVSAEYAGLRSRPFHQSLLDTAAWLDDAGRFTVKEGLPTPGLPAVLEQRLLHRVKRPDSLST